MILRFFLSVLIATASSYIFYDYIYHKTVLALLIWIIMYIASWRILKSVHNRNAKKVPGFRFKDIEAEKTVIGGIKKLRNIRGLTLKITSNDVAKQIQDICKTGAEIFEYIRKIPKILKRQSSSLTITLIPLRKLLTGMSSSPPQKKNHRRYMHL